MESRCQGTQRVLLCPRAEPGWSPRNQAGQPGKQGRQRVLMVERPSAKTWGSGVRRGSPGGVPRSRHQSGAQTEALSGPLIPVQLHRCTPASLSLRVCVCFPVSSARTTQEAGVVLVETDSPDFTRKKQRPSTKTRSSLKAQSFVKVSSVTSPVRMVLLNETVSRRDQEKWAHSSVRWEAK